MVVEFKTNCAISAYHHYVSSNPAHGDVYSIQHYVIMFVCDLCRFPPPIKLTTTENSVESGVKHHNPNSNKNVCVASLRFFCCNMYV